MTACALPEKPIINICSIDYPKLEAICKLTNNSSVITRAPLAILDHGIAVNPKDWELIQNYLHLLEDFAKNSCNQDAP